MERIGRTERAIEQPRIDEAPQPLGGEGRPVELPAGWKKLAGLEVGLPSTRATITAELPLLLGQGSLDREVAHRAVHAVMMGLAAGRWGKQGAPVITTDRVLGSVAQIEGILSDLDRIDPAFAASFRRFGELVKRALDHSGPNGLWGPTSIYGPIDNHPMNPSSLYPNFQALNPSWLKTAPADPVLLKGTGEHHFELLPGNLLAFVGPPSALNWLLGAAGNNGTGDFVRFAEGGAWKNAFGSVVEKNGTPLYELYGEAHAAAHGSKDAFFGVEGTAKRGDRDSYRFESEHAQWITVGASQVTPGRRFAATLHRIEDEKRVEIGRSEGIDGPAGIHTRVPPGKYEVVIEQIAPDPAKPELTEHPVGKRLGPALMRYREAWGDTFPEAVDRRAERDPNRYRVFVSGTGPAEVAAFGPPDRATIQKALATSAIDECVLEQSVLAMEATLATLDAFTFFRMFVPPDDTSDPNRSSDPLVERFMRSSSRLGAAFYRSPGLPEWLRMWMPAWMNPLKMLDTNLRAIGLPGLASPHTVTNHADR